MASGSDYSPPSRDEDAVTYLPVDRTKAQQIGFGPTDLRGAKATGGMKVGEKFTFVPDANMPRLTAEEIGKACDNVVQGREVWASLLYLGRASVEDLPALMEASQSYEIKVRWERLWILAPYMARLARRDEARAPLAQALQEDVAGLHLISKFAEQNNPAVRRLLARLRAPLLAALLQKLCDNIREPRRCALLCSIVATLETGEEALRASLPKDAKGEVKEQVMRLLYVAPARERSKRLSSATLREKLQMWRQQR